MEEVRYSDQHEWIMVEGDIGTVGISNFAQEQLGDVVFVELPAIGKIIGQNEEVAVVESVKAASELYSPVSGEVVEVNEALGDQPSMVNEAAEGEGWFFKLKLSDLEELESLMDKHSYETFTNLDD